MEIKDPIMLKKIRSYVPTAMEILDQELGLTKICKRRVHKT